MHQSRSSSRTRYLINSPKQIVNLYKHPVPGRRFCWLTRIYIHMWLKIACLLRPFVVTLLIVRKCWGPDNLRHPYYTC